MLDVQERIDLLLESITHWLSKDNEYLQHAVDRTVQEGLFSFEDVKHRLLTLKDRLNREEIEKWAERSGLYEKKGRAQNVLCLHAGNLPLVGFQNALATLLSGARYTGKISRKDPYLLPTFLNEVKQTRGWSDMDVQWVHILEDLEGMQNDAILFAGSSQSVPEVRKEIERLQLSKQETRYLIRTAHFSIAWLDNEKAGTMEDFVEATFRYGGKGCRSVAIVVSPEKLDAIKCPLTDYIEQFWLKNPQHAKPKPVLKYNYAYNKAIERPQAWLDDFLIQEGGLNPDQDFTLYWIQGDEQTVAELADRYAGKVQSIYVSSDDKVIPGHEDQTELLANAQRPHIYWKPDGVDTMEWLLEE